MRNKDWEHNFDQLNGDLPVDVYPCSNGEFIPPKPSVEQRKIMALAEEESELARARLGMSRRSFVRSAAAYTIGIWAISQISGGRFGRYAVAEDSSPLTREACDLEYPGAQLNNLPGEFILDVQSHHVDSAGDWRLTNPAFHVFFAAIWEQSGALGGWPRYEDGEVYGFGKGGEVDPVESLSRFHYLKQLYLDSSTNMTILSAVPSTPERQPLPTDEAALTVGTVNNLAKNTPRCLMHPFVMPNRGSALRSHEHAGHEPLYMQEEFEAMERHLQTYGRDTIRGWKTYTPWGDVSNASGWFHDDDIGLALQERVRELGDRYDIPKLICTHKGFALPGFDDRAASCRDIGPAAKATPDVNIVVYHSGYDSETVGPYAGDEAVDSSDRGVDTLIKSLRENQWDASRHVAPGLAHGNSPNVYAEIGATWNSVMSDPDQATHLLGKLITHVGPQRVVWGTDCLWFGSPQPEIIAMRSLEFTNEAKEMYNLPHGLDGDRFDPRFNALAGSSYTSAHPAVEDWPTDGRSHPERTIRNGIFGRNAAAIYWVEPEAQRELIDCDDVQKIRDGYLVNPATPRASAPLASNEMYGPRTRRELMSDFLANPPWTQ